MATTCNITKNLQCVSWDTPFTLWYFNSLVVDHLLTGCFLISSGFFMVVHMLFLGLLSGSTFCSLLLLLRFMKDLPLVHVVVFLSVAFFLFIAFVYF